QLREPVPVLDLLRAYDGLILLGDPGSGKTTFMLYLALLLATGRADRVGSGSRLPLLLPLSAYANVLADRDVPLQEFIETYYRNLGIDLPLDIMLRETLARGGALLLLDGLDEVKSLSLRHLLVDRVMTFFAFQRQSGNKMVVTSRLIGYREVRPVLDGVAECMLVDFGDEQIRDFVERWTRTVAQAVQGTAEIAESDVQREAAGLLTAVFDNSGIRRLATNPLLLTILALMRRQNVSLPQRRVELYDHYVKILIKHWNLARGLDRPPQHDLDIVETTHVLAPLALWMQETKPGLGYVPEQMMLQELTAIFAAREQKNPVQAAQQFLQDARAYTGLLLERGPGIYGFLHRTFQEFFAAVAIVQKGQQTVGPIVKMMLAHLGDEAWHEVLRLAVAVLGIVQQRDEAAGEVIMQLLMRPEAVLGTAVLLAGDALLDLWPGGVPAACREVVMTALQETMHDEVRIKPLLRMHVGAALGRLDVPADGKTAVDPMLLCYVLGSPFWLGEDVYESHNTVLTYPYWISRYPITQGQFAEFVADGGYERANFWGEAVIVARWENGRVQDWSSRGWRNAPHDYGDPFRLPNHPVVGVTWYEALAFTRWLTERWQAVGWLPPGWQVALPSEIEWEKAARGGMHVPQEPVMVTAAQLRHEAWHTSVVQQNSYPKRPYPWG
ncbi:MAG: SUMF1/EgtB/PvdO family nonheme iron enzyme, partial [Anaerolineales bacterium]|nr:SUMF1/EgtB/PvdO family nonheme iron enzyme [Anaerolineales bacterium]